MSATALVALQPFHGDAHDFVHDVVRGAEDIDVPISQDSVAAIGQPSSSRIITGNGLGVLNAIKFDAEFRSSAFKVEYEATHWRLATKRQAIAPQGAEPMPQAHLCVCHTPSHHARQGIRHGGGIGVLPREGEVSRASRAAEGAAAATSPSVTSLRAATAPPRGRARGRR